MFLQNLWRQQKEENVLEAPEITVTAPAAGETSADAVVSSSKEGKHFEAVADQAVDPATLTLNDNVQVSYSDGWGYSGYVTAENDGTNNGKFDVSGEDKAMFIRFRMKSDEITGSGTYQMLGKMDEQYGVQLKSSGVLVLCMRRKKVPGLRAAVRSIPVSGINGMIFWQYLPVQRCRSM